MKSYTRKGIYLGAFLLICFLAEAQDVDGVSSFSNWSMELSRGYGSAYELGDSFDEFVTNLSNLSNSVRKRTSKSPGSQFLFGQISAEEKYVIGIGIGFEGIGGEYYDTKQKVNVGNFKTNYYSIAIEGRSIYGKNRSTDSRFYFYGIIGFGHTWRAFKSSGIVISANENLKDKIVFFQFSPIGMSYGNKFRVNADIGLGYRGSLNVGIQYRFSKSSI